MTVGTLILWNPLLSSVLTGTWTALFFQQASIKNVTFATLHIWQNNTYIKQIEKRYGAVQIVRETTDCYVHSHLLWSKIRLHYSTFFFSLHCFLMWGRHFVAWAFLFVVSWRNLASTVKNKLLLFLLDMTLTFVPLVMVSDDPINLFVPPFIVMLLYVFQNVKSPEY